MDAKETIEGGAFLLARKIFTSEVWLKKPASWKIIWIYILGKVNHKTRNGMERGSGFFNFTEEIKDIGIDCTPDKIKKFLHYARESLMISTMKSTRGMLIKVLNYSDYQDLDNFRSTTESTREAPEKHQRSTTIHNNDNNDNNCKKEKEEEKEIFISNPEEKNPQGYNDIKWEDIPEYKDPTVDELLKDY